MKNIRRGMTLTEKILSRKANRELRAGDTAFIPVDLIFGTDGTVPITFGILEKNGIKKLTDKSRIIIINDHFSPASNIATANNAVRLRRFAEKHGIEFYDSGKGGICHSLLPELKAVHPFSVIAGADSHTCTHGAFSAFSTGIGSTDLAYAMATGSLWIKVPASNRIILKGRLRGCVSAKDVALYILGMLKEDGALYNAMEFSGDGAEHLSMSERMTICNMMTECGAKNALFCYDDITEEYARNNGIRTDEKLFSDDNAEYIREITVSLDDLVPQIACPYSPANVVDVENIAGLKIDQVLIGSCTNGSIEDMRIAEKYLRGKRIAPGVRMIVIPGTGEILYRMEKEGILSAFVLAGAVIAPSSCGACMGGHSGVLGEDEVGLYTSNRNFHGRNGALSSKVYLCSPAVAAYSAVSGRINVPGEE